MKTVNRRFVLGCGSAAAISAIAKPALAQAWPSQIVRIVVPFAPGGTTDIQARLIADACSKTLGQQFIVENRPGNSGNLGAQGVARAAKDGYTFLMGGSTHTTNQTMFRAPGYDLTKDLEPVVIGASGGNILIVNPDVPVRTVAEWIAWAKAKEYTFANPGVGTSNHLAMELLKAMAGVTMPGVSYRGAGPALNDVIAGHVPTMFINVELAVELAKAGKVRVIAISTGTRSPALPDVPTFKESGFAKYDTGNFSALWAPAGTPRDILEKVNAAGIAAFQDSATAKRLSDQGMTFKPMNLTEAKQFVAAEIERAADYVKTANLEIQ
ncbi:MAG: Bug family tripartite tricarboxylate transporter substrate binding protein [Beijerinckiaceae bacterium]